MTKHRQLAAIMFTDIEGYTALMQQDESKALTIREKHRAVFEATTKTHNGQIIQYFGDGTLSVFNSAVEAVLCAISLQEQFLETPKVPVRIGIHVGDIIYDEEDIIGDAVNIASRIESCAVSGSVLISDKVHDQVRNHTDIKTTFLDAYEFKNVDNAIPIFAVANSNLIVPDAAKLKGKFKQVSLNQEKKKNNPFKKIIAALAIVAAALFIYFNFLQPKPPLDNLSIAVLPFDNLSTDSDSDIFSDGVTEDILTHLSKLKDLHVISRTSTAQYRNTQKNIKQIARELGVAYILEGSIRKYGNKIRVTAQLIDASSDEHLWAENYDRTLTDIFAIQTEVSQEIVDALHINLTAEEREHLAAIPTQNIEAYKLFLQGRKEADKRNNQSIANSIDFYKEAITLDPNYAEAYAEIANSIYLQTYYGNRSPEEASKTARKYLDEAEKINSNISRIYSVKGLINNIERKYDDAKADFEKAIQLSPNDLTARHQFSTFYYYTQQYDKQLEQAKIAYSLDPLSFATANSYLTALTSNEKYEEAEALIDKLDRDNIGNNKFVINRSYFRLFMVQKNYKRAIEPLKKIIPKENVFNRFLGYCYAKTGDTVNAYKTIQNIRDIANPDEKSQQLAVVFAGLKVTDSVLFYLDTVRNKQTRTLRRERHDFFEYLKDDPKFIKVLEAHGIQSSQE